MLTPFSLIRSNIYLADTAVSILSCRHNHLITAASHQLNNIDPISDFELFKKEVIAFKKKLTKESWLGINQIGGDSVLYGHLNALQNYAKIAPFKKSYLCFPYMEHGISWINESLTADASPYNHNIVSQGNYRHTAIRKTNPFPHFVVGPYIHYPNPFFSKKKISDLKKKLGKTLLVIPAHTYEDSEATYKRKQYVESIINEFANQFDSIVVSAYWNDVEDELFNLFKSAGAYVVSSGLRSDPYFISRLKSLLILSDAVTGNALGSHIGYTLYFQKPYVHFEGTESVFINEPFDYVKMTQSKSVTTRAHILNMIRNAFSSLCPNKAQMEIQAKIYTTFWGGNDALKSPEEIASMFTIAKDMLKLSKGKTEYFMPSYKKLLASYPNDSLECKLLNTALK